MMVQRQRAVGISSASLFVFSLLCLQAEVVADPRPAPAPGPSYHHDVPIPQIYTLGSETVIEGRAKKPDYVAHPAEALVCRPFGQCEPCPIDERNQPFCQPFGNRRLLHCKPSSNDTIKGKQATGEVPAWEACGRVVSKERQDFWEFVTCNLLFLIVAMSILWARTSALATAQYRQLAARIGIPGSGWRG